jgi:hypothetical protein
MEKKSANELLRQIIREEVTKIIRQELPRILSESAYRAEETPKLLDKKGQFPLTLNVTNRPPITEQMKFKKSNNPLTNLLNETAMDMLNEDATLNFSTNDVGPGMHPAMAFQPREASVGSVNDMLATAKPSSNIDAVQINAVPDFSAIMDKMGI